MGPVADRGLRGALARHPGRSFLGLHFASAWMADGGRTLWGVFSCWDRGGACGRYDDRYNLMRATLTVRRAAAAPGEMPLTPASTLSLP